MKASTHTDLKYFYTEFRKIRLISSYGSNNQIIHLLANNM